MAIKGTDIVYSASLDPLLEHHLKFCDFLGANKDTVKHVVRISCMGADTNTACYDKDVHVSRPGAGIPLMLQHYWWGEEALIKNKLPVTVLRGNFFMNPARVEPVGRVGEGRVEEEESNPWGFNYPLQVPTLPKTPGNLCVLR